MEVRRLFPYVSFHPLEREIYSHDISVLPGYIDSIAHSIADVVIQPENTFQVKEILRLSKEYSIPVIPRGSATSGYGGVIPYKGGIVVDFSRMDWFEIDDEKKILTAEPGAVWWDIQKKANELGLSLRVYPTSAPSSTVGGWIAHGGIGVGSRMFGGIEENIEEIKVIDFEGTKRISGEELKFYVGMQGTTGLLVKAKIPLMDLRNEKAFIVPVEDISHAVNVLRLKTLYTAVFLSKNYMKLLNEVRGEDYPEKDILLCVSFDENMERDEVAERLWEDRFFPMRIKKKGPSIVISEVLIPVDSLPSFYSELMMKIPPGAGVQIYFSRNHANVITMIPSDEREKRYTKDWKTAFKIVKIGIKNSGKPYSTGLYLSHLSKKVLPDYMELESFKKRVDPENLLNPGKIFPSGKLPRIMKLAEIVV